MLQPHEQAEAETALAAASAEMLVSAMALKATQIPPRRIAPLAVVLSYNPPGQIAVGIVALLDVTQRVSTIRAAIKKTSAFAFAFLYDGFIQKDLKEKQDALLFVSGTAWGTWHASASPYVTGSLGAAFDPTVEIPEAARGYHDVFV